MFANVSPTRTSAIGFPQARPLKQAAGSHFSYLSLKPERNMLGMKQRDKVQKESCSLGSLFRDGNGCSS